jgi:hypothetical protein
LQHHLAALVALQIGDDDAPAAQHEVIRRHRLASRTLDAHNISTEVAEDHRGMRAGTDPGQFDDAQSGQRAGHEFARRHRITIFFCSTELV